VLPFFMKHPALIVVVVLAFVAAVLSGAPVGSPSPPPKAPPPVPTPSADPDLPPNLDENTWLWIQRGLFIALIVVGLAWCFVGYRLWKVILFLAGAVLFFYITFECMTALAKSVPYWVSLLIALGAGIAGGVLSMLVWKIGIFILGFLAGAFIAMCAIAFTPLSTLIATNLATSSAALWVTIACIVGLGIIVGIIAVFVAKHLIIISSALNGAVMIGMGSAALANRKLFTFLHMIFTSGQLKQNFDLNWQSAWPDWVILFGMVVLAVAGAVVQYRFTARNWSHDHPRGTGEEEFPLLIQNN